VWTFQALKIRAIGSDIDTEILSDTSDVVSEISGSHAGE
jgi:hypothetical protein